jgi:hypothetical protein
LKRIYSYYIPEVGKMQELVFESPLTEAEMVVNGYRYLKSEKVDEYPWEVIG